MNPGPELDKIVCEAVRIPCCICNGVCVPSVSTLPTFEQFQQIMDWLRLYAAGLFPSANKKEWVCGVLVNDCDYELMAPTIPHAVCEAVRVVVEARKEKEKP